MNAMHAVAAQTEAESSAQIQTSAMSGFLANPLVENPASMAPKEESNATSRFDFHADPISAFSANNKRSATGNLPAQGYFRPSNISGPPMAQFSHPGVGVSNCYVFKSRLQEYAQKQGLPTPVYETIKEGPSHEPSFRSTVIVNDIRYDSLPGFFNRKAAEQSAAEVALMELAKREEDNDCISQPVHETGLCKNLLQEYAQKMNYAIPLYLCEKSESPGRGTLFKCTVEIGGIQYIGASAKTKKEAEIKAARTALLAIQSSTSSNKPIGSCHLTVIPFRKRGPETAAVVEESINVPKAKKARFKKKMLKKKRSGNKAGYIQGETMLNNKDGLSGIRSEHTDASAAQGTGGDQPLPTSSIRNSQDGMSVPDSSKGETTNMAGALACHISGDTGNGFSASVSSDQSNHGMPTTVSVEFNGDAAEIPGAPPSQIGDSTVIADLNPPGEN